MATKTTKEARRQRIVELARREAYVKDGEVEIDSHAVVSENDSVDNGCYVAAWVWCSSEGTEFDKEGQP